jgi:hypothetical protein
MSLFCSVRLPLAAVVATTLAAALLAPAGPAAPPDAGVLVPGQSLGGARLGWTLERLTALWGRAYGRCGSCARETLYFNRYAFRPEGAGVELVDGRVAAIFTLWAPAAWSTSRGLRVGDPETRVQATYGTARRRSCSGYAAYLLPGRGSVRSAVYVVDDQVWGFGLLGAGARVCR